MDGMKPCATLIGDIVRSRDERRRRLLHARLEDALANVNRTLSPMVPLRITVGDEYQGCFGGVGEACHASLLLRLVLLPEYDVRHGIGWGPVTVLREHPRVEDGPGWWAARDAIEAVEALAKKAPLRGARTAYRLADDIAGPAADPVEAALLCRDHIVGQLSERSVTLLRGLLDGHTQAQMTSVVGISSSALSQRVRRDGLGVLLAADELLRRVR